MATGKMCSEDKYNGHRRYSDTMAHINASRVHQRVGDEMKSKLKHVDEMTAPEFKYGSDMFSDAAMELFEICAPPGWTPDWKP